MAKHRKRPDTTKVVPTTSPKRRQRHGGTTPPEAPQRAAVPRSWRIRAFGHVWTEDDVRASHLALVAMIAGDSWTSMNPWAGPLQLMAWMTALLVEAESITIDEAQARIKVMPAADLVSSLELRED